MSDASHMDTGRYYPLTLAALPHHWQKSYVGDVALVIQPGFASGKHNHAAVGIPHLRPMNISRDGRIVLSDLKYVSADNDEKRLADGDVLFNNTNSPELVGKTAVIEQAADWAFSNHMTRVQFKPGIDPDFAATQLHFLWMRGYFRHKCTNHVNQASISSKTLAATVPFVFPDLAEQQVIVTEIERQFTRLDAGVAGLARVRANLKRYRAAVLKAACQGTLVPTEADLARAEGRDYETGDQLLERILTARRENWTGKGKYKEAESAKSAFCGPIPEGWAWATVLQLTEANRACAYGVLQPGKDCANGIPLVRVGDINNGKVDTSQLKHISAAISSRYPRTLLRGGELLISLVGAIGRTAVAPQLLAGANTARAVGVIPLVTSVDAAFVEIWFRNPAKLAEMTSQAHEVARKTLNLEDVRAATVAVPPLAEQRRIVAEVERRLSIIDGLETLVETNLARAGRLRQSILAKAFSGELVPVSGDGTASPPPAPRTTKGPPSRGPEGRPTAGKGPVQSSVSR